MAIIKTNVTDKKELYRLTASTGHQEKMSSLPRNEKLDVSGYAIYTHEQTNRVTGEISTKKVLSVLIGGTVYGTSSPTAINSAEEIIECFGDFSAPLLKDQQSRSGRTFIYFEV